jgi:predicted transcriptional regulator
MHFASMPTATTSRPRSAISLRLDPEAQRRLVLLARAENRSPTNYVETLVLREIAARMEAARVLTVLTPDDAAAASPGALLRTEGDSDARHAAREALYDRLFALPDEG